MKETFNATVWKEGKSYIAQCREFEVASQGPSREEALRNLSEAIEVHFSHPVATILPEIIDLSEFGTGDLGSSSK